MRREINGFQMFYEDVGRGPDVLLVHGFPLDHTLWTYQLEALSDDCRFIAPDLRGHGRSEAPQGPYHMDAMADDLSALLQELGIERVVLVGLSMGGYIGLAFWRTFPHMVRALVLVDTRAAADTPDGIRNRQTMVEKVHAEGTESIVAGMLPKLLSPRTLDGKPEIVAHTRRMVVNTPEIGVFGALQGMAERPDSTPTLTTITVPTLIVVGEDDALTPPAEAEAMRDAILSARQTPAVSLAVIPGAGHLAPMESPVAFNQEMLQLLASLSD